LKEVWFITASAQELGLTSWKLCPASDFVSASNQSHQDIKRGILTRMAQLEAKFRCIGKLDDFRIQDGDRQLAWQCNGGAEILRSGIPFTGVFYFAPERSAAPLSLILQHIHYQGFLETPNNETFHTSLQHANNPKFSIPRAEISPGTSSTQWLPLLPVLSVLCLLILLSLASVLVSRTGSRILI